MWPYKTEADALNDVLRLSRGMTYKNAVAGLNIGGGKARDHRRPGDRQVRGAVPRVRPVRRLAGRPLHHRRGRRHRRQRHGIRVPRDRVRHRRAPGARRLGRPVAVHRLRHAAGPDGHAQQEVRRRGSRQVSLRRAGPGPRRHGVREAAARARRQDLRHRHQQGAGREGRRPSTAPKPSAWTRSTTSMPTCIRPARWAAPSTSRRCRA